MTPNNHAEIKHFVFCEFQPQLNTLTLENWHVAFKCSQMLNYAQPTFIRRKTLEKKTAQNETLEWDMVVWANVELEAAVGRRKSKYGSIRFSG